MSNFLDPEKMLEYAALVAVVLFCLPVHEYAHARVASAFGDDTPEKAGRLTLNPFAHLDLLGTLALIFLRFGWAKPVPINSSNFKNQRLGRICTAFAGPFSNLIMSFILAVVLHALSLFTNIGKEPLQILITICYLNTWLAVINLLPFLPFDGGQIITSLLPPKIYYKVTMFSQKYQSIISIGIIILFYFGILSKPLSIISNHIFSSIYEVAFKLVVLFKPAI